MRTRLRKVLAVARFFSRFRGVTASAGLLLALAPCLVGQPARAQERPERREPRWIPSMNVGVETFAYSTESTVVNNFNPPSQEGSRSNDSLQLMVQIGGELMGPRLGWLPGSPRPFATGGVSLRTFSSDRIFVVGDPQGNTVSDIALFQFIRAGDLARDRPPPGNGIPDCKEQVPETCATADAQDFAGQFSEIGAEFQMPAWYAGLGLSFDFPLGRSLLLQARPSIAYSVETVDLSGSIRTVIETDPVNEVFEIHEGSATGSSTDHSLGLGLELDLALFRRIGPIRTSLYLDTRFLWLVSDSTATFSGPLATYRVERDPFEVRGGAGVRFSWTGFAPR